MKSVLSDLKPYRLENNLEQHIVLGVKIIQRISHCIVCRTNKSRFLEQYIN